jgi:hypothetical protein
MDLAEEAGHLREAMAHRAPIEQAKGVLTVLHGVDPDTAFEELRRASMDHNVRLSTLSEAVVALAAGTVTGGCTGPWEHALRTAVTLWGCQPPTAARDVRPAARARAGDR